MGILLILDYMNVKLNDVAPRYSKNVVTVNQIVYYDTFFYDVIRCNSNLNTESWHIVSNRDYDKELIHGYCFKVDEERFHDIIHRTSNTNTIVISKMVDGALSDKQYAKDMNRVTHEIVRMISDKEEIREILRILSTARYTEVLNDIGYSYLFQLYDINDNLIAEFKYNYINDGNEVMPIYFDEKDILALEAYY